VRASEIELLLRIASASLPSPFQGREARRGSARLGSSERKDALLPKHSGRAVCFPPRRDLPAARRSDLLPLSPSVVVVIVVVPPPTTMRSCRPSEAAGGGRFHWTSSRHHRGTPSNEAPLFSPCWPWGTRRRLSRARSASSRRGRRGSPGGPSAHEGSRKPDGGGPPSPCSSRPIGNSLPATAGTKLAERRLPSDVAEGVGIHPSSCIRRSARRLAPSRSLDGERFGAAVSSATHPSLLGEEDDDCSVRDSFNISWSWEIFIRRTA
jgi:hypothetical protein